MAAALSVARPLVRLRGAWRVGYAAASKDTRRDGTAAPPAAPSAEAGRKMEGDGFVIGDGFVVGDGFVIFDGFVIVDGFVIGDVASIQWSEGMAIPLSEDAGGGGVIGGTVALTDALAVALRG